MDLLRIIAAVILPPLGTFLEVANCVRLDVAKVLTNHPIDEIETLISREMENA
ncbi:hypothetical protein [Marivita sp.]|uniref:hypothetical protein n=1 Tax=Marivita sp. TaxID=2003365 RepID=UPI003A8AEC59